MFVFVQRSSLQLGVHTTSLGVGAECALEQKNVILGTFFIMTRRETIVSEKTFPTYTVEASVNHATMEKPTGGSCNAANRGSVELRFHATLIRSRDGSWEESWPVPLEESHGCHKEKIEMSAFVLLGEKPDRSRIWIRSTSFDHDRNWIHETRRISIQPSIAYSTGKNKIQGPKRSRPQS